MRSRSVGRRPNASGRTRARIAAALIAAAAAGGCATSPGVQPSLASTVRPAANFSPSFEVPAARRLGKAGWVEVVSQVVASDDEAPARARARALAQARQAAIELVAGIRVKTGLLSFEQVRGEDASSLVQLLSVARADALIVEERIVDSQTLDMSGDGYRLRLVVRARVLDRSAGSDSGFETEVKLGRERFLDGEEVTVSVRASEQARIYVLGITSSGAALILPNGYLDDTRVASGQWLHFPDDTLRKRGVRLIARVPEGSRAAREAVVVVALRGERVLRGLKPSSDESFLTVEATGAGHLLADLLSPLAKLPPDAWTFDQVAYEVLAR